mmetsp:Transcript_13076/g.45731  ORF Transcript_13076/g.45731 Transcript_13076/m.45731 type:complete len:207 (-) Transcript_13076:151-771(-)
MQRREHGERNARRLCRRRRMDRAVALVVQQRLERLAHGHVAGFGEAQRDDGTQHRRRRHEGRDAAAGVAQGHAMGARGEQPRDVQRRRRRVNRNERLDHISPGGRTCGATGAAGVHPRAQRRLHGGVNTAGDVAASVPERLRHSRGRQLRCVQEAHVLDARLALIPHVPVHRRTTDLSTEHGAERVARRGRVGVKLDERGRSGRQC